MRLDSERLFRFSKNFKQFFRGQEVKTWELGALSVQVKLKTLLDFFEFGQCCFEVLVESWDLVNGVGGSVRVDLLHDGLPDCIHFLELSAFFGHLLHNIV